MINDEDIHNLQTVFYDFDGVMTDNRVLVDEYGKEAVYVNRSDGFAVSMIKKMGLRQVIISTERNNVVERRAEKLGIEVFHGIEDKGHAIKEYAKKNAVDLEHSIFIGNDLNDIPAMDAVRFTGAPKDAELEILERADWISKENGGYGVIRDFYRYLMEKR